MSVKWCKGFWVYIKVHWTVCDFNFPRNGINTHYILYCISSILWHKSWHSRIWLKQNSFRALHEMLIMRYGITLYLHQYFNFLTGGIKWIAEFYFLFLRRHEQEWKWKICSICLIRAVQKWMSHENIMGNIKQCYLTLIRMYKKTRVFEYAGSAWTPIAYEYHMKAMPSLGQFGPALFQGTSNQFVLASSSSNTVPLWQSSDWCVW